MEVSDVISSLVHGARPAKPTAARTALTGLTGLTGLTTLAGLTALVTLLASTLALGLLVAPAASATELSPTGYDLRGVVRDTHGEPVAGVGVDLYEYTADATGGTFVRGGVTDAGGAFSVPAAGGRYTVFSRPRGSARARAA